MSNNGKAALRRTQKARAQLEEAYDALVARMDEARQELENAKRGGGVPLGEVGIIR